MHREILQDSVRRATGTRTILERVSREGQPYEIIVVCVTHDVSWKAENRAHGERLAKKPYGFCSQCAKIVGGLGGSTNHHADHANSGVCDEELGCGQWAEITTVFGNVQAPRSTWVRLCKNCQDPQGQARANVTNRFIKLIEKQQKGYKGLTYKQRARVSGQFVIGSWRAQRDAGYRG